MAWTSQAVFPIKVSCDWVVWVGQLLGLLSWGVGPQSWLINSDCTCEPACSSIFGPCLGTKSWPCPGCSAAATVVDVRHHVLTATVCHEHGVWPETKHQRRVSKQSHLRVCVCVKNATKRKHTDTHTHSHVQRFVYDLSILCWAALTYYLKSYVIN